VSGGIHGAEAGSLAMMVATDAATFEALEPVLAPIAKNRFLVGEDAGQGQVMKLLNNFLSGTTLLATAEAAAYGVREGLDLALIIDVLNVSSGRSSASLEKFPRAVLPGTYDYGFATRLMQKDVHLYADAVAAIPESHAVADLVAGSWAAFGDAAPDSDCSFIYEWVRAGQRIASDGQRSE
jgi:3-hydroxyisobutyrate dehydrogenase